MRQPWLELQSRAAANELTQSTDWLLTWWRIYGEAQGRELRLGVFLDGDRVVGIAPLLRRRRWCSGVLPFRRLELLGTGEPKADAIFSNHLGIVAEGGYEGAVCRRLADAISAGDFGAWDEVTLQMMAGDTPMPDQLVTAFRDAGLAAERTVTSQAPYIPLPATWEQYLTSLTKNRRRKILRAERDFEDWSAGTTEVQCVSTRSDLQQARDVLIRLHEYRWRKDGEVGAFRSPRFVQFHDIMMNTLADQGGLEILILRARGEPIAAVYNMIWDDKVQSYQSGRRTDIPSHLSPGRVLDAYAIRRAIQLGRREFDFLADTSEYKRQMATAQRPLVQIRAARSSWVETLRRAGIEISRRLNLQ